MITKLSSFQSLNQVIVARAIGYSFHDVKIRNLQLLRVNPKLISLHNTKETFINDPADHDAFASFLEVEIHASPLPLLNSTSQGFDASKLSMEISDLLQDVESVRSYHDELVPVGVVSMMEVVPLMVSHRKQSLTSCSGPVTSSVRSQLRMKKLASTSSSRYNRIRKKETDRIPLRWCQ